MIEEWYKTCKNRGFTCWQTARNLYKDYCDSSLQGERLDIVAFTEFLKERLEYKITKGFNVSFKLIDDNRHELKDVRAWLITCLSRGYFRDEWVARMKPSDLYAAYLADNPYGKPVAANLFGRYIDTIFDKYKGQYSLGLSPSNVPVPELETFVESDTFNDWLSDCKQRGYYLADGSTPASTTSLALYQSYCSSVKGELPMTIVAWGKLMSEHFEKRRTGKGIVYQLRKAEPLTPVAIRPELLVQVISRGDISTIINEALEWYLKLC